MEKETGVAHDYGVQVLFPYEDALNFTDRFNVTLVPGLTPRGAVTTRHVDFKTGQELKGYQEPSSDPAYAAVKKFHDLTIEKGYDKITQPCQLPVCSGRIGTYRCHSAGIRHLTCD